MARPIDNQFRAEEVISISRGIATRQAFSHRFTHALHDTQLTLAIYSNRKLNSEQRYATNVPKQQ